MFCRKNLLENSSIWDKDLVRDGKVLRSRQECVELVLVLIRALSFSIPIATLLSQTNSPAF